ncbi:MAG: polyprenyl synthetase family protein [Candidatus Methylacidiphilales bacterium]
MISSGLPKPEALQTAFENHLQGFFTRHQTAFRYGEMLEPIFYDLCEFVGRKGKRIRPLLFLLTYRALGGRQPANHPGLMDCAVALELLHSFILIHDDVIDRSETRRGLPTFHKLAERRLSALSAAERTGQNVAIVVGDMVFALAVKTLHEADIDPAVRQELVSRFLAYAADTGGGEIFDVLMGVRDITRVSMDDVARMYYLKTTRYTFEAPCVMGALLAGVDGDQVKALQKVTEPLGLAFQIDNDLQEFARFVSGDLSSSADLLEGKKTFLMLEAYEHLDEVDRTFLQMCLSAPTRTESTILKIQGLVQKADAVARLRRKSQELFSQAELALRDDAWSDDQRESLESMFKTVRSRFSPVSVRSV